MYQMAYKKRQSYRPKQNVMVSDILKMRDSQHSQRNGSGFNPLTIEASFKRKRDPRDSQRKGYKIKYLPRMENDKYY